MRVILSMQQRFTKSNLDLRFPVLFQSLLLDATNGETKEYSLADVPEWVDRVYPAEETIEQINYNGKYKDGFWNAMISKKNVTQTTKGYNYLSIGNDIYLYTGVTSANADESNLGFILENMRTGEITKYSLASATEESAVNQPKVLFRRNPTRQPSQSSSTSMTSLSTSWA